RNCRFNAALIAIAAGRAGLWRVGIRQTALILLTIRMSAFLRIFPPPLFLLNRVHIPSIQATEKPHFPVSRLCVTSQLNVGCSADSFPR
ncbi:TPA: hypothetical protein ACRX21_005800, partial [Klebsiella pneumoniae]